MKNLIQLMIAVSIVSVSLGSIAAEPRKGPPAADGAKSAEWAVRRAQNSAAGPVGQKRPPHRPRPPARQVGPAPQQESGPVLQAGHETALAIGPLLPKWICPQVKVGDASDLQDNGRQLRDPGVGRLDEDFEPLEVLVGNVRLRQEVEDFVALLNLLPLFAGHSGTLPTDMAGMALARKLLIRQTPLADPAGMSASFLHRRSTQIGGWPPAGISAGNCEGRSAGFWLGPPSPVGGDLMSEKAVLGAKRGFAPARKAL